MGVTDIDQSAVHRASRILSRTLVRKYDFLGPAEFARQVGDFGAWLTEQALKGQPIDRVRARAEYLFIEIRLKFWLGHKDKPPRSQPKLLWAALRLFVGACASRLVATNSLGAILGSLTHLMTGSKPDT